MLLSAFSSCSWVARQTYDYVGEECKTRAHIDNSLPDFLSQRFGSKSQARLGIIPFTVPANFSAWGEGRPDWGYELAVMTHQELLAAREIPVIEVLDRRDWPGKAEEFYAGNFGALQLARNAGYDLVMVGVLEPLRSANSLAVSSKIIDTASGITVWYATTEAFTYRPEIERSAAYINLTPKRPDLAYTPEMAREIARCIAVGVSSPEEERK